MHKAEEADEVATRARPRPPDRLRYPFEAPTPDGQLVQVAEGVLWARMPMPMALDHINVYLLRDGEGWAVVDTGLGIPSTHALWEKIFGQQLAAQPLTRVICTHFHYDHAGAARWLQEHFGVELWMTAQEFLMLRAEMGPPPDPLPPRHQDFYHRAGTDAALAERMFAAMRKDPFMPRPPLSFQRMRDGDVLRIGERRWQVIVGEGHSPEHACLYDAGGRLLLAGDQLLPRITSNVMVMPQEPNGNPLHHWLASMRRLRELHPDTLVLPSHQQVYVGVRERADEIVAHHEEQLDLIRAHLRQGCGASGMQLMQVLFPKLRGPVDHLMALGETLAHVNLLRAAGEVEGRIDAAGTEILTLAAATPMTHKE